jgi:ATP-dependent 26S proteasome regulatory subunit
MNLWFPIGYKFGEKYSYAKPLDDFNQFQIIKNTNAKILLLKKELADKLIASDLINETQYNSFSYANEEYFYIISDLSFILEPINKCLSIVSENDIKSFVLAVKNTRTKLSNEISLIDGIFVERYSLILPTYSFLEPKSDEVLIGTWISGGVEIPSTSTRRLSQLTGFSESRLIQILDINIDNKIDKNSNSSAAMSSHSEPKKLQEFKLEGRPKLEAFFNEHIVDIIKNRERYKALGINFPSAIILHGPPGCGKTYAVEQLVNYLDWPSFRIEASSVASPYIHETSKKVAEVFEKAIENSPSVLIIDEMEAFLSNRDNASHTHNIEEMAEFLRRIPEASENDVLIMAMTNKIDMIDPAILRRGRFDHIIKVDYASTEEIISLIESFLKKIAVEDDIDIKSFAKELRSRPLSDVAFFLKEGARIAAKNGKDKLDNDSLNLALESALNKDEEEKSSRMGFL